MIYVPAVPLYHDPQREMVPPGMVESLCALCGESILLRPETVRAAQANIRFVCLDCIGDEQVPLLDVGLSLLYISQVSLDEGYALSLDNILERVTSMRHMARLRRDMLGRDILDSQRGG